MTLYVFEFDDQNENEKIKCLCNNTAICHYYFILFGNSIINNYIL